MLMMNAPHSAPETILDWPAGDVARHIRFMKDLNADLVASGEFVDGQGLAMPEHAVVVRAGDDGNPLVTDGPFAEAKEFVVGFWILETDTTERAYQIAARISLAPGPGGRPLHLPIEVREVMAAAPPTDLG
ncbi:MAG TPA: YciI family protein [Rugosimonospora sp.]|nr:YciI family protein [Rugosimonospora sp.]